VTSGGILPEWVLPAVAAATIFVVMFDLGLAIVPGDSRWVAKRPVLFGRALFAALVAPPAIAWIVLRLFDLPRYVEIGIVLMAISPGAPVALRRAIGAGGHRAFAPALQIAVATLAVITMPLAIAAFDEYYGGTASIEPRHLARQVLVAQLLPLGCGMLLRRFAPATTSRIEPGLNRLSGLLLGVLVLLALIDLAPVVQRSGPWAALAIMIVTALVLAAGHCLGGPEPATRTATAIASAMRNPGLALLVSTLNDAPAQVNATVLAYLVISALTVLAYIFWRRRTARSEPPTPAVLPRDAEQVEVVSRPR
jgi:predicted Na+-dependent transporter